MTLSRAVARLMLAVIAAGICLLGSALPAAAGDKDDGPRAGREQPSERGEDAAEGDRDKGSGGFKAEKRERGASRRGNRHGGGGAGVRGDDGGRESDAGARERERDRDSGARGRQRDRESGGRERERDRDDDRVAATGAPAGGGATAGSADAGGGAASTPAPQPAAPQPTSNGGSSDAGRGDDRPRANFRSAPQRRSTSTGGGAVVAPATPGGGAPAPVLLSTPDGETAVAPLGLVGPVALDAAVAGPPLARSAPAGRATGFRAADQNELAPVTQTVERIVEVVPTALKAALAMLALLALAFAAYSFLAAARARRLGRQREQLLDEVGLLQAALLPSVPARLGDLVSTVAYRPAEGPAAGGDFYDAFAFDGGRVGVIVGDISGHGREALARTALMRYTLRAYLDAGLEPRAALKVAGSVLDDDLGADFATVVVAVYDPDAGTLTYASAGHPPPIVLGPAAHEPATSFSSPPVGVGATTGLRQTTIGFARGSVACFYTDGMTDARVNGELVGRERLADLLAELGPDAGAPELLKRVAALAERTPDDMAACILHARGETGGTLRVEELEVSRADLAGDAVPRFLRECGIPVSEMPQVFRDATDRAREAGTAVLRVRLGDWNPGIDVLPGNVESLTAAVRRRATVAKSS